ncbi:DNA polymerase III subunit beta [Deinococcus wulumuqiensis]|uniref:Beta sliding clamp n=1 Tax=Deinococcus wulumuqiensis TaxID=980427 RepID=A0AAV4K9S5_9DEIO|nr:DNA polymerase III subunit beta [Deinococcus wulumuqiensis]QII20023.1 DNA polymerase III subunit beta [Deinococcus wulumuqiensis R12]GGI87023.1 DNA polymerase III subunit beta [Deinococcus wulumuqiensis]GGP29958.1 DNA polymerase III subunit beta [Deinococcus wulumuqiensis]
MNITVTKKALTDALSLLERVIPTRSSNPLLTALHVAATDSGLTLSGTSLEIDLQATVPAEVKAPEDFTVPAHLFAQVVRNLGGELVELTLSGAELTVRSAGSDFKLQTGDRDSYPPLTFPDAPGVSLSAADLARALGSVRYAASNEAFQAVFRGLKLERNAGTLRAAASDGYRVALCDVRSDAPEAPPLIIPARSVDELLRLLKDGTVRLLPGEGQLTVITDRARMNLKLLDGDFPDYERVIPKEIKLTATLPAAALKEAVGRVAVLADKNANNRVEFLIQDGALTLTAEGDYGRAQDTLSVTQGGTEQAMSLAFNARHVLDALGAIDGDVRLSFSGSTSPAVFEPAGDSGYRAVMVTLRA